MGLDGVLNSLNPVRNTLRGMGNILSSCFLHPMETTVIDKQSGKVIAKYESHEEYNPHDGKYLASRHAVIFGFRKKKK